MKKTRKLYERRSNTRKLLREQELPSDTTIYNSGQQIVINSSLDGKNRYNFSVEFLGMSYDPDLVYADLESYDGTPNEKLTIKIELGAVAGAGPVEAALSSGADQMAKEGIYYTYEENGWSADEVEFRFYLSDNRQLANAVLEAAAGESTVAFAGNRWFSLSLNKA